MRPGVGIIGCGLIGQKRAMALGTAQAVAFADINPSLAERMAKAHPGSSAYSSPADLLQDPRVGIVIIATRHDSLASLTRQAISAGKHVLVEKPGGRRASELDGLAAAAKINGVKVRVGFNHRYHRAFRTARSLIDGGALGPLMFIRARYGHGGRPGYEKEWRANPKISGGGELIDQGVHIIDLSRWFLGEFTSVEGHLANYFWDMRADDNCFLLLKTDRGQVAFLQASCTEWKNLFSFEIFGKLGKIEISGLGGSYGTERITHYRMLSEMGPPETTIWEFPMTDDSWNVEVEEFLTDITENREPNAGLADAIASLRITEEMYRKSGYDPDA